MYEQAQFSNFGFWLTPICAKNHPNVGFQENRQFFRSCDLGVVGLKKTVNSELATSF
jgi:hypothetical protein